MKTLISVLFVICLIGILSATDLNCTSHDPVCAVKGGKYQTFPNTCEANKANFSVQHDGSCFTKLQKLNTCSAKCLSTISVVCGALNGIFKNFVNDCFAKCSNATIVSNSSCTKNRDLTSFAWLSHLINAANFNKTERWIENKTQTLDNKTKQFWHQIGNQWEQCGCQPFDDVVNWVKQAVNDSKSLANRTADELEIIEKNTLAGFELFKNKVRNDLKTLKNDTVNAVKNLVNRSEEFLEKLGKFIKNVTEESAEWIIEEGQSLKNGTATWWHKTKAGIENCTCCLVQETDQVLDDIALAADKAANASSISDSSSL